MGDDRVRLDTAGQQLLVRPVTELAGLIEIRGLGIRRCDFVDEAEVNLLVDFAAPDAERLPPPEALQTSIFGVKIPRIPVGERLFTPAAGCRGADNSQRFKIS